MALKLTNYQYASKRAKNEGLRIGCTRFLPRGVRRADRGKHGYMDVWMPALAPSKKLLDWGKTQDLSEKAQWKRFIKRYENEMAKPEPQRLLQLLAHLGKRAPISIGCFCGGEHCHRFTLEKLLKDAARKS